MHSDTHWSELEIWELIGGVFAAHEGPPRVEALRRWRRRDRAVWFVRIEGTNRTIAAEQVDWSGFPAEEKGEH